MDWLEVATMNKFYDTYYQYKTNKITKTEAMNTLKLNATQWSIATSLMRTSGSMAAEEYVSVISKTNQEKEEQENSVQQSQTRVPQQQSSVRSLLRATRH